MKEDTDKPDHEVMAWLNERREDRTREVYRFMSKLNPKKPIPYIMHKFTGTGILWAHCLPDNAVKEKELDLELAEMLLRLELSKQK